MVLKSCDIRSLIQDLITSIEPLDNLEREQLAFAQHWLSTADEIFRIAKPATPDTHLIVYFVLYDPTQQKLLLTDHKKSGLWLPTGGHVEPGEHPWDAVKRELSEELAITAADPLFKDPIFLSLTKTSRSTQEHTDVSLWYVLKGDSNQPLTFSPEEFHSIYWFPIDELPYHSSDRHLKRFVNKLFPLLKVC